MTSAGNENSPFKKPPRVYSKVEKEAENLAQKMETRENELRKHAASFFHQKNSPTTPSLLDPPTISSSMTLNTPPVPPPRSRTPSPIISIRKAQAEQQKKALTGILSKELPGDKRKSSEIVRRPSIQKLRELFEKSPPSSIVIECPNGARLCRSASSVTSRSSQLSLHHDGALPSSLKVKRKSSLGSDQSLAQGSRAAAFKETDALKFQICPPPPQGEDKDSALAPLGAGKPPSSPVMGSILGVKRKVTQIPYDESKEEKHLVHLARLDDRPALPIKKSKSFRWSRPQESPGSSSGLSERSPEIPRKKQDFNAYFSLDRGKENSSQSRTKGESSIKKIANDFFPLHQEGLKLSVYEACMNSKPSSASHSVEDRIAGGAKSESVRPLIPPKKAGGGGANKSKNAKLLSLQIPLSRSTVQVNEQVSVAIPTDHSNTKEVQTPLSAPPNATNSFENKDFWERMRETCFENLYDELPSSRSQSSHKPEHTQTKCPVNKSSSQPQNNSVATTTTITTSQSSSLQESKDYVNARVLSSYFGNDDTPRVSYVPLPSKRESKEKGGHDYANCSVFALPEAKGSNRSEECSSHTASAVANRHYEDEATRTQENSQTKDSTAANMYSSSDYEPVDFGETLTSVDEVFETLNYELIESKSKEKKNREKAGTSRLDYYLNKDLDSLAIQVYQDCQAYLLNGNCRSPVPSLMPKTHCKIDSSNTHIGKFLSSGAELATSDSTITNLEEVRNKVSVPPQGLRNRERRNSYRQAVNTVASVYGRGLEKALDPLKKVHKYEKIWFETMKEEIDEDGVHTQKDEGEKATALTSDQDFSSNLNHPMNISGKEALFKDKLEELHGLVSNLERKKLPDLSEEELSSRDSGSTSSLFSRSAQSSRSSERVDPIYVNVPLASGITQSSSSIESSPSKSHQTSLVKGTSPYGTMATTTSHPYKPRTAPPQHKFGTNGAPGPLKNPPNAATLPARANTASSPPPFPQVQNIPPPIGFGNPVFQISNPPTIESIRLGMESPQDKKPLFPPILKSQQTQGGQNSGNSTASGRSPHSSEAERTTKHKKHHQKASAPIKMTAAFYKGKTYHHDVAVGSDELFGRCRLNLFILLKCFFFPFFH